MIIRTCLVSLAIAIAIASARTAAAMTILPLIIVSRQ